MKYVVLVFVSLLAAALILVWLSYVSDGDVIETTPPAQVGDSLSPSNNQTEEEDFAEETLGTKTVPEQARMEDVEMPDFAAETIRVKYENSKDLPDGIAFSGALYTVVEINADRPDMAVDLIAQKMELQQRDAEFIRDRLVEIGDAYRENFIALQYDLLCSGRVAKVYGDDVYSVFQTVDEAADALAEDYYYALKSELPENQSDKLTQWVDASKLNTTSIRFDYKKRYEHTGRSVDAKAAAMCFGMFEAQK